MRKRVLIGWFCLSLALSACQPSDVYSGRLILSGEHTARAGDVLEGDLVVLDGVFTLPQEARIGGSVFVLGGSADLQGAISGGVTLLGGTTRLGPAARIGEDLAVFGAGLEDSPGSVVAGSRTVRAAAAPVRPAPGLVQALARWLLEAPFLALAGWLAARFYPGPLARVRQALVQAPAACAATGLLAAILGLSLAVMVAYNPLLLPASVLLIGVLLLGVTFGGVPAACLLGRAALQALRLRTDSVGLAAAAGMALLTLLAEVLQLIPFLGDLIVLAFLSAALGAALLTRFGGQAGQPRESLTATAAFWD